MREQRPGIRGAAKGTREGASEPKISIRFEQDMFDRVNAFAYNSRCTFNEGVRLLVGYAFSKLDEEEKESIAGTSRRQGRTTGG